MIFLRPASHDKVVHPGHERILACRFSDMLLVTGNLSTQVNRKMMSLFSFCWVVIYESCETASACESSDPGMPCHTMTLTRWTPTSASIPFLGPKMLTSGLWSVSSVKSIGLTSTVEFASHWRWSLEPPVRLVSSYVHPRSWCVRRSQPVSPHHLVKHGRSPLLVPRWSIACKIPWFPLVRVSQNAKFADYIIAVLKPLCTLLWQCVQRCQQLRQIWHKVNVVVQ